MPTFHVNFCADANDPMPDVDSLPTIEATSPIGAVERIVAEGRVPQDRPVRRARVVLTEVDGKAKTVLRVPLTAESTFPIDRLPQRDQEVS